jgi:hypothetical protein
MLQLWNGLQTLEEIVMAIYTAYKEDIPRKELWAVQYYDEDKDDGNLRADEYLSRSQLFDWLHEHMKPGDKFLWEAEK